MWFDIGLVGLFITSTLLHLEEDINLLVMSRASCSSSSFVKKINIPFFLSLLSLLSSTPSLLLHA
jgi:hypothetical protein